MNNLEKILDKVKQFQELAEELGIISNESFKAAIDTDIYAKQRQIEHEYWKNLYGKYLIHKSFNTIDLIYIKTVKCYHKPAAFRSGFVSVDTVHTVFTRSDNYITYDSEDHNLCSPYVGRYDEYKEITQEQYNNVIKYFNEFVDNSRDINQKIISECFE